MVVYVIYQGLHYCIVIMQYAILARSLLSWFTRPDNGLYRFLYMMTEPVIDPFRRLINRYARRPMMMDMSPILAYIALIIANQLLTVIARLFLW